MTGTRYHCTTCGQKPSKHFLLRWFRTQCASKKSNHTRKPEGPNALIGDRSIHTNHTPKFFTRSGLFS